MPTRAKRFYLCNLIPLWEIDEPDMDVDWPIYHAFYGDLIETRADPIQDRRDMLAHTRPVGATARKLDLGR